MDLPINFQFQHKSTNNEISLKKGSLLVQLNPKNYLQHYLEFRVKNSNIPNLNNININSTIDDILEDIKQNNPYTYNNVI